MKKNIIAVILLLGTILILNGCGSINNGAYTPSAGETVPQNTADTSKFIGEERAKEIALERAGISADGVKFDRIELDRDDGRWQYEIDFRHENTEYDIDVDAETGEVTGYEKEAY